MRVCVQCVVYSPVSHSVTHANGKHNRFVDAYGDGHCDGDGNTDLYRNTNRHSERNADWHILVDCYTYRNIYRYIDPKRNRDADSQ